MPPASDGPLVLVGCDSRAAAAIARRAGHENVIGIGRRAGSGQRLIVADYAQVPAELQLAGATIVNCVGTDRGSPDALRHLNIEVPCAWSRAARERGARQLVQLSSFSVYGRTERVTRSTQPAPQGDYGRSKLVAEQALAVEPGPLPVSILRVPILVAPSGTAGVPDKLAQLAALAKRAHAVPRPHRRIERSMLTYDGLAASVERVIAQTPSLACAADPEPFTYALLAEAAREQGLTVISIPVPAIASALLHKAAPGLHDQLFSSSLLDGEDNILGGETGFLRLREVITSHFA